MKNLFKRILCGCMAAAMLCSSAYAQKIDLGAVPAGLAGLQGNTVMTAEEDNKVLSLESGKSETWTFINDAGTAVSFEQNIIVSAKYKGASLKLASGGAEYTFAAADSWQTAQLVLYPRAKKYEVFVNDVYTTKGTLAETTAVSQAVFTAVDGNVLIDDLKVEQWDKIYDEVRDSDILKTVYEETEERTVGNIVYTAPKTTIQGIEATDDVIISMRLKRLLSYNDVDYSSTSPHLRICVTDSNSQSFFQISTYRHGIYNGAANETYCGVYTDGDWFDMAFVMDAASQCFDIYVNDEKLNYEPIPYTPQETPLTHVQFVMGEQKDAALQGYWSIDDFKVQKILTAKNEYVPIVNETFDSWNPTAIETAAAEGYSTEVGEWAYGSIRPGTSDIYPEYKVTTAEQARTDNAAQTYGNFKNLTLETNNNSSGNILEAKAEYQNTDQFVSGAIDGSKAKNRPVVVHISDKGLTDKVRISADIYPVGYKKKQEDITNENNIANKTSRDYLIVTLHDDYVYNYTTILDTEKDDSYIGFSDGYAGLLWADAPWSNGSNDVTYKNYFAKYDKEQWNHFEMSIDKGIVKATVNGLTNVYSNSTISTERTLKKDSEGNYLPVKDISIGFNSYNGGWFYLDNIKVEEYTEIPVETDLSKGERLTLVQNTVDEMYKAASTEDYTVEGLYYTKNSGLSYEAVPRSSSYALGKAVIKNNTDEALTNAQVIAAVYNGTKLTGIAVESASVEAGASAEVKFTNSVSCTTANTTKLFVWNKTSLYPVTNRYNVPNSTEDTRTKVFIASDSLSAPYSNSYYPQTGWGDVIGNYLDQERVTVCNYGAGGRSTKSFYNEDGRWNKIKEEAKPGDWVLIAFAHNNSAKDEERYTNPYGDVTDETSCKYWLKKYYDDCKELGINMVLVTSIPRRYYNSAGRLIDSAMSDVALKANIDVVREFAKEYNVPMVDNNTTFRQTLMKMGDEASKSLYMVFNAEDYPDFNIESNAWNADKTVYTDNTHTRLAGAELNAKALAAGLSRIDGIAEYVK